MTTAVFPPNFGFLTLSSVVSQTQLWSQIFGSHSLITYGSPLSTAQGGGREGMGGGGDGGGKGWWEGLVGDGVGVYGRHLWARLCCAHLAHCTQASECLWSWLCMCTIQTNGSAQHAVQLLPFLNCHAWERYDTIRTYPTAKACQSALVSHSLFDIL